MLIKLRRPVKILASSFMLGGCWSASGYEPKPPRVTAATMQDIVILKTTPAATYFDITAIVRNGDSRQISVASCGPYAQRNINGTWTTVFTPACTSDVLTPVQPGDSLVLAIHIAGYTNALPELDRRMTVGQYRLVFGVFAGDAEYPLSGSTSVEQATKPFIVK